MLCILKPFLHNAKIINTNDFFIIVRLCDYDFIIISVFWKETSQNI